MIKHRTLTRPQPPPQVGSLARWLALGGVAGPLLFVWGSGELARAVGSRVPRTRPGSASNKEQR
jgi:hypothetical protein